MMQCDGSPPQGEAGERGNPLAFSVSQRLRERRAAGEFELSMPGTRQVLEAKLASGFLGGAEVRAGNSSYYLIQEELALDFPPLVGQAQRLRRQLQLVRGASVPRQKPG